MRQFTAHSQTLAPSAAGPCAQPSMLAAAARRCLHSTAPACVSLPPSPRPHSQFGARRPRSRGLSGSRVGRRCCATSRASRQRTDLYLIIINECVCTRRVPCADLHGPLPCLAHSEHAPRVIKGLAHATIVSATIVSAVSGGKWRNRGCPGTHANFPLKLNMQTKNYNPG